MPHQCLKCGKIFEEGSSELLKGCPECNGNRFFYTKEPLSENERTSISEDLEKDLTSQIMELIGEQDITRFEKHSVQGTVKTKELRKAVEKLSEHHKNETKTKSDSTLDEEKRKAILNKINIDANHSEEPETIDIEKPGEYSIDLKGLLEKEPIIIQKDGSYTIHLPSIFKMIEKEK